MTVTPIDTQESPGAVSARLRAFSGGVLCVPAHRWLASPSPADRRLLTRVVGPVLDVGCGPARHVVALAQSGIITLGIDVSPAAIALARRRGAPVLERSIFERVPGAGRWGTALLLDGNIGIGADPALLVRRVASLLRPHGRLLVEVEAPGTARHTDTVRLEIDGHAGPWFSWAHVAADELDTVARRVGLRVSEQWCDDGRWFARLDR
jgi:SAM-dependent methyltransferase